MTFTLHLIYLLLPQKLLTHTDIQFVFDAFAFFSEAPDTYWAFSSYLMHLHLSHLMHLLIPEIASNFSFVSFLLFLFVCHAQNKGVFCSIAINF